MTTTPDLLPNQRALFDLSTDMTYLNCASVGPQPKAVTDAGVVALRSKSRPWQMDDAWFAPIEQLRGMAARLFGASADDVAVVGSVSYAMAAAAKNLAVSPGQSIVVLHEQFPSNYYVWQALARESQATLQTVRREGSNTWTEPVLNAIGHDTAIVAVPNCHWTDGRLLDLIRVGERCRQVGAALVLDITQSLGAYPIDLTKIQPDFAVSVGYKWLLGPYGLGYLYVNPKHHQGRPVEQSWAARANAENFSTLVNYTDEFRSGARRFDMGEPSNFIAAPMAIAALSQVDNWGVDRIQTTLSDLTAYLGSQASNLGLQSIDPSDRVGHLTGLRFEGDVGALKQELAQTKIRVAVRGSALRVSPHLYNDRADIDRLIDALKRVIVNQSATTSAA